MAAPSLTVLVLVALILVIAAIWMLQRRANELCRRTLEQFRSKGWSALIAEGNIKARSRRAGEVLCEIVAETFHCERVLALRMRPDGMEMQAAAGVVIEKPETLRFVPSEGLVDLLGTGTSIFDLPTLSKYLPPQTVVTLRDAGFLHGCGIYSDRRLDGFCFFKDPSPSKRRALRRTIVDLMPLTAFVWQTGDRLGAGEATESADVPQSKEQLTTAMFKAIRFRHADTLVKKLVTMIQKQMQLERMAFVFASNSQVSDTHVVAEGLPMAFELPTGFSFSQAFGRVAGLRPFEPIEATERGEVPSAIQHRLESCGLAHVTPIPLSSRRMGIMAWSDGRKVDEVAKHIEALYQPVCELVENAEAFEILQELSYTDPLTGLANQRYFQRRLREELTRAGRYRRSLAFILIDLDDLKVINDSHGHQAGDDVLRRMGAILKDSVRSIDVVVRYGGDEFGIIMPETTEADCERFMVRLQKAFSTEHILAGPRQERITYQMSMGGAIFPHHGTKSEQLVFAADMALLKAKDTGRNTWRLFSPELLNAPEARS